MAREGKWEDREENRRGRTGRRRILGLRIKKRIVKPKIENLKVKGKGGSSISSNKLESIFSLMGHKFL